MKIIYIHADDPVNWNTAEWRCAIPARAFQDAGHEAKIIHWYEWNIDKALEWKPDIVVFQRYCWGNAISDMKTLKKNGVITVYDFDDDYETITPTNKGYPLWKEGIFTADDGTRRPVLPPQPMQGHGWIREIADVSTAPARFLCDKYGVTHLPNYPTERWWKKRPKLRKKGQPVIGWGGGTSHVESWRDSNIIPALLDAALVKNWRVRIVGPMNVVDEISAVKESYDKVPMTSYRPFMKAEAWPGDLTTQFDLVVIPLAGDYDLARSPIKVIECGLAGVPWIASNNGVYREYGAYGTLVQNTRNEWFKAIIHAMDNNRAQRQAAFSARNWFLENVTVEKNLDKILEVYGYED